MTFLCLALLLGCLGVVFSICIADPSKSIRCAARPPWKLTEIWDELGVFLN